MFMVLAVPKGTENNVFSEIKLEKKTTTDTLSCTAKYFKQNTKFLKVLVQKFFL